MVSGGIEIMVKIHPDRYVKHLAYLMLSPSGSIEGFTATLISLFGIDWHMLQEYQVTHIDQLIEGFMSESM